MAEDEGLEAIRAKRLAELQAQYGGGQRDQEQKQQAAKTREEDMKNSVLSQILEQGARARLNSIALVKPDKAKSVEMMLIRMAQSGQISGKVGEGQLVELLERINQQTQKSTKVKFERRRQDSDDEF
ncbi:Programmed cell death protein 5 [Geodia barretti]|uniref:Programmed cell death protein 5 n=1 Tax=Geodia barretti TaxID=519541 RepID=A0AA35SSX2_GEOBA|nr:Programmed cell death protein 5 [Geodia barretti]